MTLLRHTILMIVMLAMVPFTYAQSPTLAEILGSDVQNAGDQKKNTRNLAKINLYTDLGLKWVRASGGVRQWWANGKPTPENFATVINYARQKGMKVFMHIEYRPDLDGGSVYDYDWYRVGRDFCAYFGDKVDIYDIFNEVDHLHSTMTTREYVDAYEDFIDGVHSVDPNKRIAIQLAGTPMIYDKTVQFFQAAKHLFNNGKVTVMNLHTYNNAGKREDIYKGPQWAQYENFNRWKKDFGINRDIFCGAGEFQWRSNVNDTQLMALGVMPVLYSQLAVQQAPNSYNAPRTLFANIFALTWADPGRAISCAEKWEIRSPNDYTWIPNARGRVYQEQLKITQGMRLVHTDMYGKGFLALRGNNKKGWVYFGIAGFGSESGANAIQVTGVPRSARTLKVYSGLSTAQAPLATINLNNQSEVVYTIPNAMQGQTLLLVADSQQDNGVVGEVTRYEGQSGHTQGLTYAWWNNIKGIKVTDLTGSPRYPGQPSGSQVIESFQLPTNHTSNSGAQVSGYLTPPVTGNYQFWIASDDQGELWLGESPSDAEKVAYVPDFSSPLQWDKYAVQASAPIRLQAGKSYYIMALRKEGKGGDNLSVAWAGPGINQQIIGKAYLTTTSTQARLLSPVIQTEANPLQFEASVNEENAIMLSWHTLKPGPTHFTVYNSLGEFVTQFDYATQHAGKQFVTLDHFKATTGVYIISCEHDGKVVAKSMLAR